MYNKTMMSSASLVSGLLKTAKWSVASVLGLAMMAGVGVANAATVSLTPNIASGIVGDTFNFTIDATDFLDGSAGGQFTVNWDPSVFTATGGAVNNILWDVGTVNLGTSGQASINFTNIFGPDVTGPSFGIATLSLQATGGPVSPVLPNITMAASGNWFDLNNVNITSAVVFNGATVTVNAIPVPAAVWLFGSGLLGLVGVARRRSRVA